MPRAGPASLSGFAVYGEACSLQLLTIAVNGTEARVESFGDLRNGEPLWES